MSNATKIDKYASLRETLGYTSVWCMYNVNHFDEVAFTGHIARLFFADPSDMTGKAKMVSVEINKNNPTWFDVWKACEEAIVTSKTTRFIFIEEIIQQGTCLYMYAGS